MVQATDRYIDIAKILKIVWVTKIFKFFLKI